MPWNTRKGRIKKNERPFYHIHFDTEKDAKRNARIKRSEGLRVSTKKSSIGPGWNNYYYH